MASRTVRRLAPAMLVAALAAPAGAQEKPVAAAPRAGVAHDFAALRRQADTPLPLFTPVTHDQWIEIHWQKMCDAFNVRLLPHQQPGCAIDPAFVIGAGGLTRVMPMPEPPRFLVPPTPIPTGSFVVHGPGSLVVTTTAVRAVGCEGCAAQSAGTWYREVAGTVVAVTFAGDTLTAKMTTRDGDLHATVTVTAHCTAAKDGLVYGAITGADVVPLGDRAPKIELAELSMSLQELVDHPFSFRAKMTPEGLSVSGLKFGGFERDKKELLALCGLYRHAKDGKVPEPRPQAAKAGRCEECRPPVAFKNVGPDGLERIGVDFAAPAPVPPRPVPPAGVPPADVKPIGVIFPNDAMKQMAADAFGQMMLPPATVPNTGGAQLPRLQAGTAGMTLPSPRYLEHDPKHFCPDPAFPLPRELAAQEDPEGLVRRGVPALAAAPVVSQPKHVGTWVREVGSKRCVLKVTADHFTLTISEAREVEEGKVATAHMTFTVEYHLTRDGVTAVGLVTGADFRVEGDLPDHDTVDLLQKTGALQKALEDMPMATTLRVYGDAMVVGSVRMPSARDVMEAEPTAYLGGRYRLMTEKALSPLKAVKFAPKPATYEAPLPVGGPVGAYGDLLPPQYVPPRPPVVLPAIPTVERTPLVPIVPTTGVTIPAAPPVRVMPTPKPPGEVVPVAATENRQIFQFGGGVGVFGSR